MSWFTKKKKEETRIPEVKPHPPEIAMPKLPELPRTKEVETDSEMNAIKNNISPPNSNLPPTLPHVKKTESTPKITGPPTDFKEPMRQETGPIFVKIEKFKNASENFVKIKEKVEDIEDMLEKIKHIKEKEDQELKEWEHEIQVIKSRVDNIDDSLFKKL